MIAGSLFLFTAFKSSPVEEPVINDSVIEVDRSNILGEGKELIVQDEQELVIPIEITNPTDKNTVFNLQAESEGIRFTNEKIYIQPQSKGTAEIIITPDMDRLKKEDYHINVYASLIGEQIEFNEEISFDITKKRGIFDTIIPYIIIGLLIAAILAFWISRPKKEEDYDLDNKFPWKTILIILIAIVVIASIASIFLLLPKNTAEEPAGDLVDIPVGTTPEGYPDYTEAEIMDIPQKDIVAKSDNPIILDITITNPADERAEFRFETQDESWISLQEDTVELAPNAEFSTYLVITPDMESLESKDYQVSALATLEGESVKFKQDIHLDIKAKKSWYNSIIFYILLGSIALLIALLFMMRSKTEEEEMIEEPVKPKKKLTNIKVKKKK